MSNYQLASERERPQSSSSLSPLSSMTLSHSPSSSPLDGDSPTTPWSRLSSSLSSQGPPSAQQPQNLSSDLQLHTSTPPSPLPSSPTSQATLVASPYELRHAHSSFHPSAPARSSLQQADGSSPPAQGPSAQQSPVPTRRLLPWFREATRAREGAHRKRG